MPILKTYTKSKFECFLVYLRVRFNTLCNYSSDDSDAEDEEKYDPAVEDPYNLDSSNYPQNPNQNQDYAEEPNETYG